MKERNPYQYEEEGISLKELLLVIIRGKKTIAIFTAVVLFVALCGSVLADNLTIGSKGSVQSAFQIYFEGIEVGRTPDGELYDPYEVKSAEILQRAMDNMVLAKKPAISKLSSCIAIKTLLPDDAAKMLKTLSELKTEQLKIDRLEQMEINPDSFIVTLTVDNGLGISKEEGRELLDNILLEYKEWLLEKYGEFTVLANPFAGSFDLTGYDYIQIADLMDGQLASMERYVESQMMDDGYAAVGTGASKASLLSDVEAIRAVDVEKIYTDIASNYITKNAGKSSAIYEKLAEDKDRLAAQKTDEAGTVYNMIANYKHNEQTYVLGDDLGNAVQLRSQSEQYDKLIQQYSAAFADGASASADAAYYRAEAQRFASAGIVSGQDTLAARNLESAIGQTIVRLKDQITLINETVMQYYRETSYQKYMEQILPAQDYDEASGVNIPLNLAIALVAGLLLGILVVLFKEYIREEKREVAQ